MLKSTRSNDVAILGYGCRLPGADGPEAFWRLLTEGRCSVTEIQGDRWQKDAYGAADPAQRGKSYVWAAGQLDDPWAFDPDFFGISPREAEQMDPQQRLVLQVAWEALEHAGLPPSSLPKDRTGVYVGASSSDYANRFYLDPASIDSQFMTGNTLSLISNRVSYALDLHGPSQTVDTACSSGLYALHYAVEALRAGRIDTAIVGAVNMLLSPFPFIGFSRASMLSKTGLCRAFDADGDGYVRSEGAVVFVLRAEHAAIAEGDRIRGYVAATGVNTDGRTPGVSQPSAARQADLLAQIYDEGGVDPDGLAFVEAHGTGTAVGDPIEAAALGGVIGQRRSRPLPIGSVKTNIGHLEAGAGLAGLLKAQMALERGALPASLHFRHPNPNIDFEALNLRVAGEATPLHSGERPLLAGVNSFGFGGANGHAVLRQAATQERPRPAPAPAPLIVSARSPESLAQLADDYRAALEAADDAGAARIANAAAYRRDRLSHRLVIPAETRAGQIAALAAYAVDPDAPGVAAGQAAATSGTAFVFSGNGAQWVGMGRESHLADPVFRETFDRVADIHAAHAGVDLSEALHADDLDARLDATSLAQPLLFAIQAGLVTSLAHLGLRPDAVIGHSVGEVAAAWAAGIYSLEDATRLIGLRSSNQEALRGLGRMTAVAAAADEIAARLADEDLGAFWIAADNSPRGATVAGDAAALARFDEIAEEMRWAVRRLDLDYPFHSGFADPMREKLLADLAWLKPEEARIPFVSTAYGRPADGHELGPAYWWKNIRSPVRFREGVDHLAEVGCGVFLEIGPKPVLRGYLRDCLAERNATCAYAPTLEETGGDARMAAARALALGARFDNNRLFGPDCGAEAALPRYPWRNRAFRAETTIEAAAALAAERGSPLLGQPVRPGAREWRRSLDVGAPAWMADHVVQGAVVAPAAAMLEMAFAAAAEALDAVAGDEDPAPIELSNFAIAAPIALDAGAREVRVAVSESGALRIETRRRLSDGAWRPAAACRVRHCYAAPPQTAAAPRITRRVDHHPLYDDLSARGLEYGPAFRLARSVAICSANSARVDLSAPDEAGARRHLLHPAVLDAALHGLMALLGEADDGLFLPVGVGTAHLFRRAAMVASAEISVVRRSPTSVAADIVLRDAGNAAIAAFRGFRFKAAPSATAFDPDGSRYETRLVPLPAAGAAPNPIAAGLASGVLTEAAPPPSPAALLAEAAAQRICLDALRGAPARSRLAGELRRMLEREGLIAPDASGRHAEVAELAPPTLPELFDALVAEAPRAAGTLAWLSRLAADAHRLCVGDPDDARAALAPNRDERTLLAREIAAEARWSAVTDAVLAAIGDAGAARSVLLLGAPPAACVDRLADAGLHRLWLIDPDEGAGPSMHSVVSRRGRDALVDAPEFDLIVAAPVLAPPNDVLAPAIDRLAPGGALLLPHPEDNVLDRLEGGGGAPVPAGLTRLGAAYLPGGGRVVAVRKPPSIASSDISTTAAREVALLDSRGALGALPPALAGRGIATADAPEGAREIVFAPDSDGADPAAALAAAMMMLHQPLTAAPERRPARLWIVTRGGTPRAHGRSAPGAAAVLAFARVLANEHPGVDVRLLDLDPELDSASAADRLAELIADAGPETEIALGGDGDFAVRVVRAAPGCPSGAHLRLTQNKPGDIESLAWRPTPVRAPEGDEIEIAVAAAGLNFRDVMWAQGLLPEEALEEGFAGPTLGMECAGTVVATGPEARFRPGDQVICYAPACFAQRVTVSSAAAAPVPKGVDPEAAAAIPTAFLTARYALAELARIASGETVLIHGAAGGVGLAAIQIALALGARVIATAGSPAKRALVRALGADAAFDGRTLGFAEEVMKATDGAGVDVVLNSLAGEAMARSLECLKPFGRFVELGKRDFYADSDLGLKPFRRNLSYFGVDADQLMRERPQVAARILSELGDAFADGTLTPPPVTAFDAEDAVAAFRLMQKSGHVGKILIRPPSTPVSTAPTRPPVRSDAAYLVVGGVSGFGAATAEWLVENGATRIHLSSRAGRPDADGEAAIARMRAKGARVALHAADAADAEAMADLFAEIDAAGAPLRGVVHAAMVLDDALYAALDRRRIERVLRPKVAGAEVIDRLSRARTGEAALDFFVAYASATTLVGNPGQAAYVAANAWLEALMRARRREGLPGLAVAWGAIADRGVVAREAATGKALATRLGASRMTAADALAELGRLLADPDAAPVVAFGDIDWAAARRELALLRTPLFEPLNIPEQAAPPAADALADRLRALETPEALAEIAGLLAGEAARILRLPAAEIDPAKPLTDMGFDSLMAMDLRMALEETLGLEVPLMSLAGGASLADVARLALERIAEGAPAADPAVEAVVERHVAPGEGLDRADVEAFAHAARTTERLLS